MLNFKQRVTLVVYAIVFALINIFFIPVKVILDNEVFWKKYAPIWQLQDNVKTGLNYYVYSTDFGRYFILIFSITAISLIISLALKSNKTST